MEMKTERHFISGLAAVMAAMSFVSCTEGNADQDTKVAAEIAGEYSGLMGMSVSGNLINEIGMKLTMTPDSDETVTVKVPAMQGMGEMTLPAFDITGVSVGNADDGSYIVSKESIEITMENMTITVSNLSGTVSKDKKEAKITFDLKPGAMPFAINCAFDTNGQPTLPQSTVYEGKLTLTVNGTTVGNPLPVDVTVDYYQSKGSATLKFPAFGEAPMAIEAFEIEGVTATDNGDGSIGLALEEITVEGETPLKITGLTGSIDSKNTNISFNMQPGAMPFAVACQFTTAAE